MNLPVYTLGLDRTNMPELLFQIATDKRVRPKSKMKTGLVHEINPLYLKKMEKMISLSHQNFLQIYSCKIISVIKERKDF